jgi:GAF domain-containing protein
VLDYDKLIQLIKETVIDTMKANSFILLLYDQESDEYCISAHYGELQPDRKKYSSSDPCIQLIKLVNSEIFKEELVDDYGRYDVGEYASIFNDLNAVLLVPMTYKGVLRGIICLGDKEGGDVYTDMDVELLTILANQAIIALDNARLYNMAMTDELTNLYITRFFNQRIVDEIISAIRSKRHLSLLMIDVDHFKNVNDTYGHQTGDMVLKEIALQMEEAVRGIDLVAVTEERNSPSSCRRPAMIWPHDSREGQDVDSESPLHLRHIHDRFSGGGHHRRKPDRSRDG